jgi:hypothetical protein
MLFVSYHFKSDTNESFGFGNCVLDRQPPKSLQDLQDIREMIEKDHRWSITAIIQSWQVLG